MSDETPPPPKPPVPPPASSKPTRKTSTIPLKKETVRITLRPEADQPVATPANPAGTASATSTASMQKTQKVTVMAPKTGTQALPAATAQLQQGTQQVPAGTLGTTTSPAKPGSSQPLTGTQALQSTSKPLPDGSTSHLHVTKAEEPSKFLLPFSILCGLLSLFVLFVAFVATDKYFADENKGYGFLITKAENPKLPIPEIEVDADPPVGEAVKPSELDVMDEPVETESADDVVTEEEVLEAGAEQETNETEEGF